MRGGEPRFVIIMLLSIAMNYMIGLLIGKFRGGHLAGVFTVLGVICNLGILIVFKYLNFLIENLNLLLGQRAVDPLNITLPIGISFFTFQAISYIIDVFNEKAGVQKSIVKMGLYISLFPQLIAGPIVRYDTVMRELDHRVVTTHGSRFGIKRFMEGFCKKVILSNSLAVVADIAFTAPPPGGGLSVSMAWLGAAAYTLQIYFDFSDYSDMAIGLGAMLGFHFEENFSYPYTAKSITDFWRRWHISLSGWFRDYVYIPLGGSHVHKKSRHILNLFVVWSLTGIWHGASWNFILWGIFYFVLLVIEKYVLPRGLFTENRSIKTEAYRIFTIFAVMLGWVLFRAVDLPSAFTYLKAMFGLEGNPLIDSNFVANIHNYWSVFALGVLLSTPVLKTFEAKLERNGVNSHVIASTYFIGLTMLFVYAISFIIIGSYNPCPR